MKDMPRINSSPKNEETLEYSTKSNLKMLYPNFFN